MKVAIVTPWFPNAVNAASGVFVFKDAKALRAAGHDVTVFHLVPPHEDSSTPYEGHDGLSVVTIPMSTSNPVSIYQASKKLLPLLEPFDILHTQALSAIEPFVFGHPGIPWVHTEHWSAITTPNTLPTSQRLLLPLLLKMIKKPDVVVSVCDFLARPLRAQRGQKPVVIIPCQVPAPPQLIARPERGDTIRLISTGALTDRKDPLLAVRILDALRSMGVSASLVWLGDGELREAAQALAEDLQVDAQFPGVKSPAEVAEALANADMFIGPTKADNFFVAAAESIVNGRPLVVGANGGQGEYIDASVGRTIASRDPEEYACAIVELHEATRDMTAEQIAQTVGHRFEPETIAQQYTSVYNTLTRR